MHLNPAYAPFGTVDDAILAAVARLHLLTSAQLCQRFWRPTSLTAMRARTKELADHAYLERVLVRRTSRAGSAPLVYRLGTAGRRRLRRLGVPLGRFRRGELAERSELFVQHTLALNDVLLSAERLGYAGERVRLAGMRHEHELKRSPLASGRGRVVPDAWLEFHLAQDHHWLRDCFLIELDRGTEGMRVFRGKVARLATLDMDVYARTFGTTSFGGFLVVTTAGTRRLGLLRRWIEDELAALRREDLAELFFLTARDPAEVAPADFFLGRHWRHPWETDAATLLSP